MPKYAEHQPRDGDLILHCGHLRKRRHHFYFVPEGSEFTRPDGSTGSARWFMCCDRCFRSRGPRFLVRGEVVWQGDEPYVTVPR